MQPPEPPFGSLIAHVADALGVTDAFLTAASIDRLSELCELTSSWGRRMDLTAARSREELVDLIAADALILARHASPGQRWVDVGSGAGAPGLALALLRPDLHFDLIEPRTKRVAFLRHVVGSQRLERVAVRRQRVEGLDDEYDVAVSRATFPPVAWLAWGARLAPEIWVLLAQSEPPPLVGYVQDLHLEYSWPLTAAPRLAVRYRRSGRTG